MKKIGILGGSFDPIHKGHLYMAESAKENFDLDEVWLMPAAHSPNKSEARMTVGEQRLEMCRLAVQSHPGISVSDFEYQYAGTSYTYLTLTRLAELYPDTRFYYIMGGDSLDYFDKWRHPEIIASHAVILVIIREGFDLDACEKKIREIRQLFSCEIYPVPCKAFDISSTQLRNRIKDQQFCMDMLEPNVYNYIREHHLYE